MRYRVPKHLDDIATKAQKILGYELVEVYHPAPLNDMAECKRTIPAQGHWSLYHKDGNSITCYALVGDEPKSFHVDLEDKVIKGAQG